MPGLAARIAEALTDLVEDTGAGRLVVAASGGLDSTVLMACVADFARRRVMPAEVVHVDHALQADSARWARACAGRALALGLHCTVCRLDQAPPAGVSLEAWARAARYAALAGAVGRGVLLLTAHHADDQAETVLQRVLDGAGPHGLAGIPRLRPFADGHLGRPLLDCPRVALLAHARERHLAWHEDPANADQRHPRNRLRHGVLPVLRQHWPAAADNLRHLARVQGDTVGLLDLACDALLGVAASARLPVAAVLAAPVALRPFLLRRWLVRAGVAVPGRHRLAALLAVVEARRDALPRVTLGAWEVRRHAGELCLLRDLPAAPGPQVLPWTGQALDLPWGSLRVHDGCGGLRPAVLRRDGLSLRFRRGGERCRLAGETMHRELKTLLQAWRVPPWERERLPLVYLGEELVAVPGHAVMAGHASAADEAGVSLQWEPFGCASPARR